MNNTVTIVITQSSVDSTIQALNDAGFSAFRSRGRNDAILVSDSEQVDVMAELRRQEISYRTE